MREVPVRTDTILLMILISAIVIGVWVLDIVKDVQDLQTRIIQIEEVNDGKGA